ncbi:hypothetical protein [Geothrix sp. 21YS21S-4]|uniref:hypothetical protein n=1 Tax=Geothrix sp. 21YS21S-4 TaxID=3068889 RepID=UPI0027BABD3D|nr:hypothetical protein [Geothrix sp. 21YS21S-4]
MTPAQHPPIRPDWISKTLAGALLGFTFALGASGLMALALHGLKASARAQLVMWMVAPIWLAILAGCYAFRSGKRAWACLGAANGLLFLVLGALRLFCPIGSH